jgi:hypothetical protein
MIRYTLKCQNDHSFESWFKSAEAYEGLRAAELVVCPDCQDTHVEKSLMAPQVRTRRDERAQTSEKRPMTNTADPDLAEAIRTIREHVEKNSDYVGDRFAKEARAMHNGETPQRSIYGEVRAEDARKLAEEGVPAVPLPFIPKQKTN